LVVSRSAGDDVDRQAAETGLLRALVHVMACLPHRLNGSAGRHSGVALGLVDIDHDGALSAYRAEYLERHMAKATCFHDDNRLMPDTGPELRDYPHIAPESRLACVWPDLGDDARDEARYELSAKRSDKQQRRHCYLQIATLTHDAAVEQDDSSRKF
jgi:hypothetical protein